MMDTFLMIFCLMVEVSATAIPQTDVPTTAIPPTAVTLAAEPPARIPESEDARVEVRPPSTKVEVGPPSTKVEVGPPSTDDDELTLSPDTPEITDSMEKEFRDKFGPGSIGEGGVYGPDWSKVEGMTYDDRLGVYRDAEGNCYVGDMVILEDMCEKMYGSSEEKSSEEKSDK
ncbi:unnamed protein product [Owenia fusiformis]|uniref:Uncharacterized protein n=1 Tax=Owenia fusiformis TaxID=6347 RepID=A0A8J1T7V3_OWEFU|nr:unnamed protein product [Owenia fusiformis]